jgi:ribosomal protein S18 acetylase RimI-like enzyme
LELIRANIEHLKELVALFEQYRAFYKAQANYDGAYAFIEDRLTSNDSVIFIALDFNKKGMGFVQLYPAFSSVGMKKLWLLNDLYVHEKYRKLGLGKQLMNAAKDYAVNTEAQGLKLATQVENQEAKALYQKLGYKKVTAFDHYVLTI